MLIVRKSPLGDLGVYLTWIAFETPSFILGNIGLWLFLLATGLLTFKIFGFKPKLFIPFSIIIGLISLIRNFSFWAFEEDKYVRRGSIEEGIGRVGCGCLTLFILPLMGAIIGFVIFLILK